MNSSEITEINNRTDIKETNKKENYIKKKSSNVIKDELLKIFNDEEEKNDLNIVYNESGKKSIKYISLDLLLKKIVIDDFIEKNILLIYHFCQQCFCFIDYKILFNKIINCYQYYRSKGVPPDYMPNIITFFNVIVIEMYQYCKESFEDESFLFLINKFYEIIEKEFGENYSHEKKNENSINIRVSSKGNNYENLPDENENIEKELIINSTKVLDKKKNLKNTNYNSFFINPNDLNKVNENGEKEHNYYYNNYYSINDNNINNNINMNDFNNNENKNNENENKINIKNRQRTMMINSKIDDENEDLKKNKEINDINRSSYFDDINKDNTDDKDLNKNLLWSNTDTKNKEDKTEQINKNLTKKHFFDFFKRTNKEENEKKNRSCDIRNYKKENNILKKSIKNKKYRTKDEEILKNIKDIKNFISNPKSENQYIEIKNSILFYKIISNKTIVNNFDLNNKKKLKKSQTEDNIFKKKKKIIESKNYFNALDYEEKDIANKLFLVSDSLINKIQRKELYKGVFLKKNKHTICPNVMKNIDNFNRLSFFIILDIISYDNPKDRAKMIEKWVKVAEYCKKINDFNDLLAINSALNNYIITGLKLTRKHVTKKILLFIQEINKFCDCQGNYKTMRDYTVHLKQDEYYLPYLGILLRDLAFNEESSKYIINGVLINLEKIENVQKILDKFFRFSHLPKKQIGKIPKQLNFFENLENIEEEKLEKIANNIEPIFNFSIKKLKRPTYVDTKYFSNTFKNSIKD